MSFSPPPHPTGDAASAQSRTAADLRRERDALAPMRHSVPVLWAMLNTAIARADHHHPAPASPTHTPRPPPSTSPPPTLNLTHALGGMAVDHRSCPSPPDLHHIPTITAPLIPPPAIFPAPAAYQPPPSPALPRPKRLKLPVPADRYPDYNFVGRLLGPRGTTLKTLERDSGCKIMIRGKGSIRNDKVADVRGKPGWEHVFNEPLHVVIEAAQALDDTAAVHALIRAKEAVELLLVPVPEERDGLKRQQLRDLAILNGTFRGTPLAPQTPALHQALPGSQGMPPRMCHSASLLPSSTVSGTSIHAFGHHPLLAPSTTPNKLTASTRSGRSVPQSGTAPMPLHGVPGGAIPTHFGHQHQHQQTTGYPTPRTYSATHSSVSSSCTVPSSPPPMGSAWGAASGASFFPMDALGHGFLGDSAATSYSRQKTPASAPPPRTASTSCSSLDEEDESRGSSSANSMEGEEGSAGTKGHEETSPNSSSLGLVFMGGDFYNGAFANTGGAPGTGKSIACSPGTGVQSAAGEEQISVSRRSPWTNSNPSKSKTPPSPANDRQASFDHSMSNFSVSEQPADL